MPAVEEGKSHRFRGWLVTQDCQVCGLKYEDAIHIVTAWLEDEE